MRNRPDRCESDDTTRLMVDKISQATKYLWADLEMLGDRLTERAARHELLKAPGTEHILEMIDKEENTDLYDLLLNNHISYQDYFAHNLAAIERHVPVSAIETYVHLVELLDVQLRNLNPHHPVLQRFTPPQVD